MHIPKVKICCIKNIEEANLAIHHGASAIGLVSHMPSGPGVISEETIKQIIDQLTGTTMTFLLTSLTDPEAIISQHRRLNSSTIQLVDSIQINDYVKIKNALPGIQLVQVIHVTGEASLDEALLIEPHVDMLLLDSGNPNLEIKELGGTGRVHNWKVSRKIVEEVKIPVFLAGGLHSENVRRAIDEVNPYGLDLCSSVRTHDALDPDKLTDFFNRINHH